MQVQEYQALIRKIAEHNSEFLCPWCKAWHRIYRMHIMGVDLTDPDVSHLTIEKVGRVLSKLPRFGGDTDVSYPVAAHCLCLSRMVSDPTAAKGALMHDTSEMLTLDLPRPFKRWLGTGVYNLERTLDQLFQQHFSFDTEHKEIWFWDDQILYLEKRILGATLLEDFQSEFGLDAGQSCRAEEEIRRLFALSPRAIEYEFVKRYYDLTEK